MKALSRSFRLRFTLLIVGIVMTLLLAARLYVGPQVAQLLSDKAQEELAFKASSLAASPIGMSQPCWRYVT